MKTCNNEQEFKININWFPGHMAKGMRELRENAFIADLIIVLLDARCPLSSYNNDFENIAPNKPRLFICSKIDLMDSSKQKYIENNFNHKILWLDLKKNSSRKIILNEIKKSTLVKQQNDLQKGLLQSRIKVFVVGVPNVGKSTLINLISGKNSLKVANYPGVTKIKNWVNIENIYLMDTPGILLPKMNNQKLAIKLAAIDCINNNIFPKKFLVYEYLKLMNEYYPNLIKQDFNYEFDIQNEEDYTKLLEHIGKKMNFINTNKQFDFNRIYTYIINWIKKIKNITFD